MTTAAAIRDTISADIDAALEAIQEALERVQADPSSNAVADAQWFLRLRIAQMLVPSVMAATCVAFAGNSHDGTGWADVVNGVLLKALDELGERLPQELADHMEQGSKLVDPGRWEAMQEGFGEGGIRQFSRQSFDSTLSGLLETPSP
ncbi:MAG: hypothetical protein OXS47_04290 [Chloroflexota bacterium]|nr:hypothetical protein [Chloroflexota bacterium]